MPIYEYRCAKGHQFEVIQSMADDPVTECEECGASVERVFHPIAVHFKGSGFYTTDYAKKGSADNSGESKSDSGSKSDSDSGSKADSSSNSSSKSDLKSNSKSAKKSSD